MRTEYAGFLSPTGRCSCWATFGNSGDGSPRPATRAERSDRSDPCPEFPNGAGDGGTRAARRQRRDWAWSASHSSAATPPITNSPSTRLNSYGLAEPSPIRPVTIQIGATATRGVRAKTKSRLQPSLCLPASLPASRRCHRTAGIATRILNHRQHRLPATDTLRRWH